MFVDMRGSTRLAEKRLPFDTVFIVNRFLSAVSQAVIECGGQPNQFVGDGQLALFGLSADPQTACRQGLQAAAVIAANVAELNHFLAHDLREPICFGIGIHGGEVIIGDIGYRNHMVFTALGDAVNVAARLQDMTKSLRGYRLRRGAQDRGVAGRRTASPRRRNPRTRRADDGARRRRRHASVGAGRGLECDRRVTGIVVAAGGNHRRCLRCARRRAVRISIKL